MAKDFLVDRRNPKHREQILHRLSREATTPGAASEVMNRGYGMSRQKPLCQPLLDPGPQQGRGIRVRLSFQEDVENDVQIKEEASLHSYLSRT